MAIDFGSLPDWLAGVGAVVALLWARRAARAAGSSNDQQTAQLAHQQEQWEAQREASLAQQAERVAAWIEFEDDPLLEGSLTVAAKDATGSYYVCFQNASDLPVFEILIRVRPPGVDEVSRSFFLPVLKPNSGVVKEEFAKKSHMRSWRSEIKFRDSQNQCWKRDHFGVLIRDHWEPRQWDFISQRHDEEPAD